jgi:glutathione synthase/RimK-type ligase-like ATP-grasp enzyme
MLEWRIPFPHRSSLRWAAAMDNILILTQLGDVHAYAVSEVLRRKGAEVTLVHASDFPTGAAETVLIENSSVSLEIEGPELGLVNPSAQTVWHRRPAFALDESRLHPADREFAQYSCLAFRQSFLSLLCPTAFWVNPHDAASRASRKILQHRLAAEAGFETPATIYTNDPAKIRAFIRRQGGKIVYKVLTGQPWRSQDHYFIPFTSVITEADLVEDYLLQAVPSIYQALVPKDYELRITIMGRRVFAVKILSQQTSTGNLDWRRSQEELDMRPVELPAGIEKLCIQLMQRLGIVFGCFDLIVTPEGKYIFLEVNEMGQFLFVEHLAGIPLLDAFSEFLLQGCVDFEWSESRVAFRWNDVREASEAFAARMADLHVHPPERSWDERVVRPGDS